MPTFGARMQITPRRVIAVYEILFVVRPLAGDEVVSDPVLVAHWRAVIQKEIATVRRYLDAGCPGAGEGKPSRGEALAYLDAMLRDAEDPSLGRTVLVKRKVT